MKDINKYLKSDTKESSTRLALIRSVNTAIFIGVVITLGCVAGFIISIVLNKDLAMIASVIGAFTGLGTGLVGAFLLPSFGGKAFQSFAENKNKPIEEPKKEILNG